MRSSRSDRLTNCDQSSAPTRGAACNLGGNFAAGIIADHRCVNRDFLDEFGEPPLRARAANRYCVKSCPLCAARTIVGWPAGESSAAARAHGRASGAPSSRVTYREPDHRRRPRSCERTKRSEPVSHVLRSSSWAWEPGCLESRGFEGVEAPLDDPATCWLSSLPNSDHSLRLSGRNAGHGWVSRLTAFIADPLRDSMSTGRSAAARGRGPLRPPHDPYELGTLSRVFSQRLYAHDSTSSPERDSSRMDAAEAREAGRKGGLTKHRGGRQASSGDEEAAGPDRATLHQPQPLVHVRHSVFRLARRRSKLHQTSSTPPAPYLSGSRGHAATTFASSLPDGLPA
jgi:hypothetical protein